MNRTASQSGRTNPASFVTYTQTVCILMRVPFHHANGCCACEPCAGGSLDCVCSSCDVHTLSPTLLRMRPNLAIWPRAFQSVDATAAYCPAITCQQGDPHARACALVRPAARLLGLYSCWRRAGRNHAWSCIIMFLITLHAVQASTPRIQTQHVT